jgi:fatty-acyl-CoA synthase
MNSQSRLRVPNDVPLSPISFLNRSAVAFGHETAVIEQDGTAITYAELRQESARLARALARLGIERGDRVAVLELNTRTLLASHFGVPASGGVLVALNTRLAPPEYAYILGHCAARVLLVSPALVPLIAPIRQQLGSTSVVEIAGANWAELLGDEPADNELAGPPDERDMIAINYTSGTTGSPKGVVYTHRGAYLNALSVCMGVGLTPESRYLWTLPMFHCNGWSLTWGVTAAGARHICLDKFDPELATELITRHDVTHLCGAPVVLNALARHALEHDVRLSRRMKAVVGGAPPSPTLISSLEQIGIDVLHMYGLTETYGPCLIGEPQTWWSEPDVAMRARLGARQGVRTLSADAVRVVDTESRDVHADGTSVGEIVVRSNTVMAGYFEDPNATSAAFADGWFHTGDLAVVHPDGNVEVVDRSKDIIISGGENISSVEVERVLAAHPAVLEVAVVAARDEKWGEVPVAFVACAANRRVGESELIEYAKGRLAHFKAPKRVIFGELPKTGTGKIQKFVLRQRVLETPTKAMT